MQSEQQVPTDIIAQLQAHRERVWNLLIPRCAVSADIEPHGVRYLHPTKRYKWVGKRRCAVRGVA